MQALLIALIVFSAVLSAAGNDILDVLVADTRANKEEYKFGSFLTLEDAQTAEPTAEPTANPTNPTAVPTLPPTSPPTNTNPPISPPSAVPSAIPSVPPTPAPTNKPSAIPSAVPSANPTPIPSFVPTPAPSGKTKAPTISPTAKPSRAPTSARPTPGAGEPTIAPSAAPTFTPSAAPTRYPTFVPTVQDVPVLSFSTNVSLGGLTSPILDNGAKLAIVNTTAISMKVSVNSVKFLGYVATAEARRLLRSSISLFSTTYSITYSTAVSVPIEAGKTSAELYNSLTQNLAVAISTGAYNKDLQKNAAQYNVSSMASVNASAPVFTPAQVDAPPPPSPVPSDNDDSLSGGAIAGIVIGVVVGVALIVAGIYYWFFVRKESGGGEAFQSNADVEISL